MPLGNLITELSRIASVSTEGNHVPLPPIQIDNFSEFKLAISVEAIAITGASFAGAEAQSVFYAGSEEETVSSSVKILNSQYKELIVPQVDESFSIRFLVPSWIQQITIRVFGIVDQSSPQTLIEARLSALENECRALREMLTHSSSGMLPFSSGSEGAPISWRRLTLLDTPIPYSNRASIFKFDFPGVVLALDELTGLNSIAEPETGKLQICGLGRGDYEGAYQVSNDSAVKCDRESAALPYLVFDGLKDGLKIPLIENVRTIAMILQPTTTPAAFCPVLGLLDGQCWHVDTGFWLRSTESQAGFTGGSWWFNGVSGDPEGKPISTSEPTAILIQTDSSVAVNRIFCDRDAIGRYFPGKLWMLYLGNQLLPGDLISSFLISLENLRLSI